MKLVKITLFAFGCCGLFLNTLFAAEAVILYTGQTHAMLYQCSCPIQKDGGVARRGTLIKELRKNFPELLLLDSGSFTAGGLLDEYTQSAELDRQRSQDNFRAMQLMQYDAVGIGPDEFNFGKDFFLKNARKSKPAFLSANLDADQVLPYMIKKINGVKIGVIGLTNFTIKEKAEGIKINLPDSVEKLVNALRNKGVEVVAVLSTLGEKEDLKLVAKVKGIDIIFVGWSPANDEPFTKIESTFFVRPTWQGRKLGKLTLQVTNGKLVSCKVEQISLSDKFLDDPAVSAIIPRCYADVNCKQAGLIGNCKNPGELKSECLFTRPKRINLTVVGTKDCLHCSSAPVTDLLKRQFPGVVIEYLYLPDPAAEKLIRDLSIQILPAYLLGTEIESEKNFDGLKNGLEFKGNYYLLKSQPMGRLYLLGREFKKGNFDMFFSIFDNNAAVALALSKEFAPQLHFLAVEKGNGFNAKNGNFEIEEYLRGVCTQKHYPDKFWDYLSCRLKNIGSYYWEDCLSTACALKVKACARGAEGAALLKENIVLGNQLQITSGLVYLFNNNQIFYSQGVPDKEELKKMVKNKIME